MTVLSPLLPAFERNRPRLRRLAHRMLRDADEVEDLLQEAWLKVGHLPADDLRNVDAWLTTVTTRLCLDRLRQRSRHDEWGREPSHLLEPDGPERDLLLADTIGVALLVILERLGPLERVAFVLHDLFSVPFEEIAVLIDRSVDASRQLASRARRRVRGSGDASASGIAEHRRLAESFLHAARTGDMAGLLEVLNPDARLVPDAHAARMGPGGPVEGAGEIARFFAGRAAGAHLALIDDEVGLVVARDDALLLALLPRFVGGRIAEIRAVAEPDVLSRLTLGLLP